jgi:hypothetical protein
MLADLQIAEFIYEQPATGDIEYTFKHALTQEVAVRLDGVVPSSPVVCKLQEGTELMLSKRSIRAAI